MDLFEKDTDRQPGKNAPLAARMRPKTLEELVGQEHILGKGKLLYRAIKADRIGSIILWGPPGTGKTTLAEVIASATHSRFEAISAVAANVETLRRVIFSAANRLRERGEKTTLFIDEIHRFNKAQQDVLLPYLENGTVSLIGATTHNPCFYVNAPLLSRSIVFELRPLAKQALRAIVTRALKDPERGLGAIPVELETDALDHILSICDGDARKALNALEMAVLTTGAGPDGTVFITKTIAEESVQRKAIVYDRDEDGHYDIVSAFIKSMRGSDPDAALYWLAVMIEAGEDPRFIARRILIFASEDVGNADPRAILIAGAAMEAVERIGMPEAKLALSQATCYVASAPKSNASYIAIKKALEEVQSKPTMGVPRHLREASYRGASRLGRGKGYKYSHDYSGADADQDYTPRPVRYYEPRRSGYEAVIAARLVELRRRRGGSDGGSEKRG